MLLHATSEMTTSVERTCPGCGGIRFRDTRIVDELCTHTCVSCGLIVSSIVRRRPKVGQYANVDLRAYLTSVGALRNEQSAALLSWLRPHVRSGMRVLDVGCGFGSFLAGAREIGCDVSGIEPDANACAGADKVLGEGVVRQGTLQRMSLAAGSADIVASLDVLEHVPADEHAAFARAITHVLAPGGLWVIKIPSTEGLYYQLSSMAARIAPAMGAVFMRRLWQIDYEFPHTVYFNRRSLQTWLHRHDFTVVDACYLPEVPVRTVIDRLTHDGDISRTHAYALVPAVAVINAIEWLRRRSDALVVLARRG
jgi:2-polyprenyl-3-methyl-5-hydroxy-6-metoxy-1,4-benzoquinol methylase